MKRYTVQTRLTVGFTPAVTVRLAALAREHDRPREEVIAAAVAAMLDSFAADEDFTAFAGLVDIGSHLMCSTGGDESGDFDPLAGTVEHRDFGPRFTGPADVYLDARTAGRLSDFCGTMRLGRAWAIRMAVDRYLFDSAEHSGSTARTSGAATD